MRDRELVLAVWANRAPGSTQKNRRQTVAFRWSCHPQVPSKAHFPHPLGFPSLHVAVQGHRSLGLLLLLFLHLRKNKGKTKVLHSRLSSFGAKVCVSHHLQAMQQHCGTHGSSALHPLPRSSSNGTSMRQSTGVQFARACGSVTVQNHESVSEFRCPFTHTTRAVSPTIK